MLNCRAGSPVGCDGLKLRHQRRADLERSCSNQAGAGFQPKDLLGHKHGCLVMDAVLLRSVKIRGGSTAFTLVMRDQGSG